MHHSDKFDHHLVSSPPEFDSFYRDEKGKQLKHNHKQFTHCHFCWLYLGHSSTDIHINTFGKLVLEKPVKLKWGADIYNSVCSRNAYILKE